MNYYKITNEYEIHYGLKYKTGLNVDIIPFAPLGDCFSGGIYFSREDILAFINYGPWIRQVTLPEGEPIYENPNHPKKWKAHRVILGRRRKLTAKVVKKLLDEGANPRVCRTNDLLLWNDCDDRIVDIVKVLVKTLRDTKEKDGIYYA